MRMFAPLKQNISLSQLVDFLAPFDPENCSINLAINLNGLYGDDRGNYRQNIQLVPAVVNSILPLLYKESSTSRKR